MAEVPQFLTDYTDGLLFHVYCGWQDVTYERVKKQGLQRAHNLSRELAFMEGLLLWDTFLYLFALLRILTTYVREAGDGRWAPVVCVKGSGLYFSPRVLRKFLVAPAIGVESGCRSRSQNSRFRDGEPQWGWERAEPCCFENYVMLSKVSRCLVLVFHPGRDMAPLPCLGKARPFVFTAPPPPHPSPPFGVQWWLHKELGPLGFYSG